MNKTRTSLIDYLACPGATQTRLAKTLGITQGAIHQMIRAKRQIFVIQHENGSIELREDKPIAGPAHEPRSNTLAKPGAPAA